MDARRRERSRRGRDVAPDDFHLGVRARRADERGEIMAGEAKREPPQRARTSRRPPEGAVAVVRDERHGVEASVGERRPCRRGPRSLDALEFGSAR